MQLKHIQTQVGKYDTHTDGTVVAVPEDESAWLGRHVYWDEYKEGVKISREGKEYAFIKMDTIQGYDEGVEPSAS